MIYTFFSGLFITLFMVLGALSVYKYLERVQYYYRFNWSNYRHVIVLAVLTALCFIAAVIFGTLIPDCYGH